MKFLIPEFWKKKNITTYILWPLTIFTRIINFFKNLKNKNEIQISTICVGNIYLGGTGKTQLVIKLNKILKKDYNIYVIKKYYKDQIDEQKLLSKNSNLINGKKNRGLIKLIKGYNNKIKIFEGKYILKNRKDFNKSKNYIAFCGIGTPDNFFNLLKENKINVKEQIIYPDHYNYRISDIYKLENLAFEKNCQLITTEKDIMKLKKFKKFKVKFTKVDFKIDNEFNLIKFLKNNL